MDVVRVIGGVNDLARDMRAIPLTTVREARRIVTEGARAGTMLARDFARSSAGRHGKHYHRSITYEVNRSLFGGAGISAEYGPEVGRLQGGMSFEFGSRNQPPHLDLNRSADIIAPAFGQEVRQMVDGLFW